MWTLAIAPCVKSEFDGKAVLWFDATRAVCVTTRRSVVSSTTLRMPYRPQMNVVQLAYFRVL